MNARLPMLSFLYFAVHLHCTLSTNSVERIIGGVDINIESVPYVKTDDHIIPNLAQTLKCIKILKIGKKSCYKDYKDRYTITPQMICYGYQDGAEDSCKGDSGAALVNKDNIMLGVTSWGDGCAEKCSPGIYTDAVCLRDWIKNKINTIYT
ncbi:transmembrane serine 13 [Lasius niger]|uniref:Transmembrane serine 13 n=1 Tax=Lasius niger TaxID=67767 RepID=A0A0J7KRY1_LASNI|nr:transmembrane serine 13 [Lasius niger]